MNVRKSNGKTESFSTKKLSAVIKKVYKSAGLELPTGVSQEIIDSLNIHDGIHCSVIRNQLEEIFMAKNEKLYYAYKRVKDGRDATKNFVEQKKDFINRYKQSSNTANATVDDNSNVSNKSIGVLNAEIHKQDNIQISRGMVTQKLAELFPDFDEKSYRRDLESHIIYKHDESSFGAIAPYCVSISMYPFLLKGIKGLGGLSASPKNLDSFSGMFVNLIFATSAQFAGACMYKDQKILVTRDDNKSYNIAAKEFIECFDLNGAFNCGDGRGTWEYADLGDLGFFVEEQNRKVAIKKVYRRKYDGEIYTVKTSNGLECRVSGDHRFKVLSDIGDCDGTKEVPAKDLRPSDIIFIGTNHRCMIDKNGEDFKDGQFMGLVCSGLSNSIGQDFIRLGIVDDNNYDYIKKFLESYFLDKFGVTGTYINKLDDPHRIYYEVESFEVRNKICDNLTPCKLLLPIEGNVCNFYNNLPVEHKNRSLDYQVGFLSGVNLNCGNVKPCNANAYANWLTIDQGLTSTVLGILENLNIHIGEDKVIKLANDLCHIEIPQEVDVLLGDELIPLVDTAAIESIETFKNDDEYVYEIETESHWYNCGGIITHNCASPEFLVYLTYFSKKEWGDDFWQRPDDVISINCAREMTIRKQLHQYFQQIVYSINQPAASRGMQSAFWNVSYFDKAFFEGMFSNFYFPDGTQPDWESTDWIQREFMQWFNEERSKTMLTFPVESFALVYKDGNFVDPGSAQFVAEEYARGHSFFTYISDTVDSLSSCCRLKNKIQTKEFNFTNGNMGVETGSKSVITLNLNRIIQDWARTGADTKDYETLRQYLYPILERVFMYHVAYNELLWDMYNSNLLSVYKAGFIDLNKQYLTIGLNGLNQSAEFLGIECNDNPEYEKHCQSIFSMIKEFNESKKGKFNGHQITLNTECVPAESLAIKNYNWDKEDGYVVSEDTNLYASYIYKPNDPKLSVLDKLRLHGSRFIGDYLDGGYSACYTFSLNQVGIEI